MSRPSLRLLSSSIVLALLCGAAEAGAQFLRTRFEVQPSLGVAAGTAAGRQPWALGEVSGDARPDLLIVRPAAERVDVWHGDGGGGFAAAGDVAVGAVPVALALADVVGIAGGVPDGIADLLVGDAAGALRLAPGRGDGTFAPLAAVYDGLGLTRVVGIAAGDLDGAPGADVALIDDTQVVVLCHTGSALAPCGEPLAAGIDGLIEIVRGDLDGDGIADLAVLSGVRQRLVPFFGAGAGRFERATGIPVQVEAVGGIAVDLDVARLEDDAFDDLVVVNYALNFELFGAVLRGRADRRLRVQAFVADFEAAALAVADFDGEPGGGADVMVGYRDGGVTVNLNQGASGFLDPFVPVGTNRVPLVGALAAPDLNGDGRPDLLVLNAAGDQVMPLLNRSGSLCPGDCNVDDRVTIDELVRGVAIALGEQDRRDCLALDRDGDAVISIAEIIAAVAAALNGCATAP